MIASYDEMHKGFTLMERIGGGFASALAKAWFRADRQNQAKIEHAFADLIEGYVERAKTADV